MAERSHPPLQCRFKKTNSIVFSPLLLYLRRKALCACGGQNVPIRSECRLEESRLESVQLSQLNSLSHLLIHNNLYRWRIRSVSELHFCKLEVFPNHVRPNFYAYALQGHVLLVIPDVRPSGHPSLVCIADGNRTKVHLNSLHCMLLCGVYLAHGSG